MVASQPRIAFETLTPFLYPCLLRRLSCPVQRHTPRFTPWPPCQRRNISTTIDDAASASDPPPPPSPNDSTSATWKPLAEHLNPSPDSYSLTPFTDRCTITLQAGNGGHGCVSFLREKFIPDGPPNGGDGGSGGGIYVQALRDETSLHKLVRRGMIKAGRGRNGRGKAQGGERGEDAVFTLPVGPVVREVWRHDPVEADKERAQEARKEARRRGEDYEAVHNEFLARDKWIMYPGTMLQSDLAVGDRPPPTVRRSSVLTAAQPPAPIRLDLDTPMERPMLLAAGALGGHGNARFVTRDIPKPKYASKGDAGMSLTLSLELKVLADVGLVGLPNAGKSTLLRALTASRTRIGSWAFTTLQPSIGTVVLDAHRGRPALRSFHATGEPRTGFTIADIPGLIEGAHLDKGLGLGFLRHVERAAVLAFVVDLGAGDAVVALKALWREVGEYETLRNKEISAETERSMALRELDAQNGAAPPPPPPPPISSKPWFVVATKADLPDTRANFEALTAYVDALKRGEEGHPSGRRNGWRAGIRAVPVCAINAEGVQVIPKIVVELLG